MIRSVRARLLGGLLAAFGLLLLAGAATAWWVAHRIATLAYDQALLDVALAIAGEVQIHGGEPTLNLTPRNQKLLLTDKFDVLYYQVRDEQGKLVAGQRDLPQAPPPEAKHRIYFDTRYLGHPLRAAAYYARIDGRTVAVTVAETLVKRSRLSKEILLAMLLPELALALSAAIMVWISIGHGLSPFHRLQQEVARRNPDDLSPMSEHDVPSEAAPLIREINLLLERIRHMLDHQKRFLADAAHQLRTPLAGLRAQLELARSQADPAERVRSLEQMGVATANAAHLVHQLLTLARVENREAEELPLTPLRPLLRETAETWLPEAIRAGVDLGFELEDAEVRGEPWRLREMAGNLIDNAIRYGGSIVTVRVKRRNAGVCLEVEDNGSGIPDAERERVFDRFHRLNEAAPGGCGLGLAIVREIARDLGAAATIETPEGGRGTRAVVWFPSP